MVWLPASIKKGGKWYITPEGRLDLVTASAVSDLIPGLRRVKVPGHQQIDLFRVQQLLPKEVLSSSTPVSEATSITVLRRPSSDTDDP